jgi:undecaprenyl-diphosphatase
MVLMPSSTAAPSAPSAPTTTARARTLHHDPPATPLEFFSNRPRLLASIVGTFCFLAVSAAISRGAVLLTWDRPIQKAVESRRGDEWDALFLTASRFGSTIVVLTLGALFALLTWRRCRAVSVAVLAATVLRPGVEWLLKDVVGRARPDFGRLVAGTGYSFPSGHVMAAVALWGLLPMIVGLYSTSRRLWWASVAVSATMIGVISASRVYLGVHWFSDIVGGLLVGSLFLIGVDWVMRNAHRHVPCDNVASA